VRIATRRLRHEFKVERERRRGFIGGWSGSVARGNRRGKAESAAVVDGEDFFEGLVGTLNQHGRGAEVSAELHGVKA
jgi:hypothetical protein